MNYLSILKKCIIGILIIVSFFVFFKLTIFYIPFLIAYIISIVVDPAIKFVNKKTSLSRKVSSIIVLVTIFSLIATLFVWGIVRLAGETTNLLGGLNIYLEKTIDFVSNKVFEFDFSKFKVSDDVINIFEDTTTDYLNMITKYLKDILTKVLNYITSLPNMFINIIITILATYFITSDKFYILDRMEHHLSKKMVGKIAKHAREITSSLGGYLRAEIILSIITFMVVLTGLNVFYLIGMEVDYPILMAIVIGFIDALPILGAGSVMLPWSLILFLNNNNSLAFSVIGLYIFIVVLKQLLEPKLVSNNIGIHPIFTLLSMYTGFKILGIFGLLLGPIVLIIIKNIFAETLDKGIINSIMDI